MNKDDTIASFYERINSKEVANMSPKTLLIEDWLAIQTIESSYLITCQQHSLSSPSAFSDRKSFIGYWSRAKDQGILQLIGFLRQIKEFKASDEDDRFTLIKYNLLPVGILYKCLVVKSQTEPIWDLPNVDIDMCREFLTSDDEDNSLRDAAIDFSISMIRIIGQDFTLLRLLLVALLFSKGLSMIEDEPRLNDPLALHQAHSHYTRLIWNYLMDRQDEQKTIRQFT
jgi:hypothetical protein